jgi:putative DNA primase/helicase
VDGLQPPPEIRGADDAIWKRLKLIPFDVTIDKAQMDLKLGEKLRAEMTGVLAWTVRGCMAWVKHGLGDPPEVSQANLDWREHDDPLKEFIEDCCQTGEGLFVRASDLAAGYEWWAKQARERYPLGRESFNERLLSKGFKQSRGRRDKEAAGGDGKQFRAWEGIELLSHVVTAARKRVAGDWKAQAEE